MLFMMCMPAISAAATSTHISLLLSKTNVSVGKTVTASGKTETNAWVALKVVDKLGAILVYDQAKADASGKYSISFKVPTGASGLLTVVVGEGNEVANKKITVGKSDTTVPTWSNAKLRATKVKQTGLTLTWKTAHDNVGVTGYRVYQDTTLLTSIPVTGTSYNVTGLTAKTRYTFKVEAGDAADNWSTKGPKITVTTTGGSGIAMAAQ